MTPNGLLVIMVVCAIWIVWAFKDLHDKVKKMKDELDQFRADFKRYDEWVCDTFDDIWLDISIIRKYLGLDKAEEDMEKELNDLDKEFHEQAQEPHGYTQGGSAQRFG